MFLLILLVIPLFSSLMLAIIGDRKYAPEVNILGSATTCAAGIVLALQVYEQGPLLAWERFLLCRRLQHLPVGAYRIRFHDHRHLQQTLHAA